jgi:signal transduction histidine kinase
VETDFRHNSGPIIVRPGINQAKPISTDRFKTARLGPKVVDKAIEKENIGELVQVPLFVHGQLVYIVVLDKYGGGQILYDVTFTESEIQLLGTIARLTSFALERIHLLQQVFSQASIGASIGVFAHEIAGCVRRLSDIATLYRNQSSPPESMTRELIFGVDREAGRMQRLREFFTSEVLKQIVKGPQYTTITHEVESAIALLGLTHSELVRKPNQNIRVQVPRLQRPLCLILLELLNNARRATRSKDRPSIRISFKQCKRRTPHMNILSVSDNGEGISELVAHMFRNEQFIIGDLRERGLGLHCARLLAEGQGWILRLARRRKPTRFEILIPTFP